MNASNGLSIGQQKEISVTLDKTKTNKPPPQLRRCRSEPQSQKIGDHQIRDPAFC